MSDSTVELTQVLCLLPLHAMFYLCPALESNSMLLALRTRSISDICHPAGAHLFYPNDQFNIKLEYTWMCCKHLLQYMIIFNVPQQTTQLS